MSILKESTIIQKYRHTALFYLLATIIPWTFWFAAAYVSHHFIPENRAANGDLAFSISDD